MEENYRRLHAKYNHYRDSTDSRPSEAKAKVIGDLNASLTRCLDLEIESLGNIEANQGTLYFKKADHPKSFEFNVLSSGEKEVALEAICGWSTCHHQLVLTETHKEPGKRWFESPFGRVLEQGRHIGQFDFDETFVMEQFFIPRAHGFAKVVGVEVETSWDPQTRIFSIALV